MIKLSQRQFKVLKILKENDSGISSSSLCSQLDISSRTLRYEIKEINQIVGNQIVESGKYGYRIKDKESFYKHFKNLIINTDFDAEKAVVLKLLKDDKTLIYDIAEDSYISESTVINIVKQLKERFHHFGISLKKRGNMIYVEGSEKAKRELLSYFFFDEIDHHTVHFKDTSTVSKLHIIKSLIKESIQQYNTHIDTIYLTNITVYFVVTIHRIAGGYAIEEENVSIDKTSAVYSVLLDFVHRVEDMLSIHVSSAELSAMFSVLSGLLKNSESDFSNDDICSTFFKEKIRLLLNRALQHYQLQCSLDECFNDFCTHTHYLLLRIKNNVFFKGDKTLSLKVSHPYIYEIAVYLASLLEDEFCCHIPQDEIDLLAIYVGVITRTVSQWKAKIVVICPKYREVRSLLVKELQKYFPNIIDIAAIVESHAEIPDDLYYDFVISTVNSEYVLSNTVYVSPLLAPQEVTKLETKFKSLVEQQRRTEMKREIFRYFDERFFFYDCPHTDGKSVLEFLHNQLLAAGIAAESLMEDVHRRELLASTIFPCSVAIPHALHVCSQEIKIAYYYSSRPIDWFGEKVHLVLLLLTHQYDFYYLHLYNLLIDIFSKDSFANNIASCKTIEAFIEQTMNMM